MICLWLEMILDAISNQSAITSWFTNSLGSFKPNCQLVAVGHDCARITEAAVTVVPGYGHGFARRSTTKTAKSRHYEGYISTYATQLTQECRLKKWHCIATLPYEQWIHLHPSGILILKPDLILPISTGLNVSREILWDLSTSLF